MTIKRTRTVIAVTLSLIMALAYLPCTAFAAEGDETQDIDTLKQAMEETEGIMNQAKTEMDEAKKIMDEAKTAWDKKKEAAETANTKATESETTAANAEKARDDAFAKVKADAKTAYDDAVTAYNNAKDEYDAAVTDYKTKQGELDAAKDQKSALERDVPQLQDELAAAKEQKEALEAELPGLEATVTTATNKWHEDQEAAQAELEQAQEAFDAAGRNFINAKINEKNGHDLDDMISACKTYNSLQLKSPVTDKNGTTYATIANIANSESFEKIIDRACAYDNLKKDINFMREANEHRNLTIHNSGDLKVSYQLMGTAMISAAIDEYLTGHNLINYGDIQWSFWNSGNSMTSAENLAYSPVSDNQGWDPFHGWYYKERMVAVANERGVGIDQNIVDEILEESTANGFPYNPYGAPWNQSKTYFLSNIGTQTGHYESLLNSDFKATGFCYVDAADKAISYYPYVASQEFNGDTSASVSIDRFEQELDSWFEGYLSDLDSAQSAVDALEAKPEAVTGAEAKATAKESEITKKEQEISDDSKQIEEKNGQITTLTSQIATQQAAVNTAEKTMNDKETAKNKALSDKNEMEAANTKAQNLNVDDPATYEDAEYSELKTLAEDAAGKREQAVADRTAANAAAGEAETAEGQYNTAKTDYDTKKGTYDIAVTNYNKAEAAYKDTIAVDINGTKIVLSKTSYIYNGKIQKPVIKTIDGRTLTAGTDYTAVWSNASSKNVGTYTVTVTGKDGYKGTAKATYKILRAKNTLVIKPKTPTVKYSKLKKKTQTIKRTAAIYVAKNKGKVTYAKASGNKKITINKKTGVVTVKKGLKKGKYKVKVKVTAAGNANYYKITKSTTFTVKVK